MVTEGTVGQTLGNGGHSVEAEREVVIEIVVEGMVDGG